MFVFSKLTQIQIETQLAASPSACIKHYRWATSCRGSIQSDDEQIEAGLVLRSRCRSLRLPLYLSPRGQAFATHFGENRRCCQLPFMAAAVIACTRPGQPALPVGNWPGQVGGRGHVPGRARRRLSRRRLGSRPDWLEHQGARRSRLVRHLRRPLPHRHARPRLPDDQGVVSNEAGKKRAVPHSRRPGRHCRHARQVERRSVKGAGRGIDHRHAGRTCSSEPRRPRSFTS